jgi:hypothetical protein
VRHTIARRGEFIEDVMINRAPPGKRKTAVLVIIVNIE